MTEQEERTAKFLARDPETDNMFARAENLTTVIGEAIGAGSVCWESMRDAGVFQDQQAKVIVDHAVQRVRELVDQARSDEIAEVEHQRDRAEQIAEERAEELNARDATAAQVGGPPAVTRTLAQDLQKILSRHHIENASNTPDFILADYLMRALEAGEELVNARHKWWGMPDPWAKALGEFMPEDSADTPEDVERHAKLREKINEIVYSVPDRETHKVVVPMSEIGDGELLELMGTDAQRWAYEFSSRAHRVPDMLDEGWLVGWFANAIEIGRSAGWRARQQELDENLGRTRPSPTTNADLD